MNAFLQVAFDFVINVFEAFFIYLLLSKKLQLKQSHLFAFFCFLFQSIAVTYMNQFISTDGIRMSITLGIDIVIALILSTDTLTKSIFWGCAYPIITTFSDTMTVLLGELLVSDSSISLMEYPLSIVMTFLYLFICFCSVLFLINKHNSKFSLPWFIQGLWIITIVIGIVTIEFLLDVLIQFKYASSVSINRLFTCAILLLLILFFSISLFYYIGILYQKNLELIEENRQKQFEKQQFELLSNTNQLLRTWKHDLQQHLSVLEIMLKDNDYLSAQDYLNSIHTEIKQNIWQVQTGNHVLDAVLTSKLPKIQSEGICFTHSIFLPEVLPLGNLELTSLMGNLFDNAIEACEKLDSSSKKYITLDIKPFNKFLYINMVNSSNGDYHYNLAHQLLSAKQGIEHGIGLKRIQQIVTETEGFMQTLPGPDSFHITIVFPLPNKAIIEGEKK